MINAQCCLPEEMQKQVLKDPMDKKTFDDVYDEETRMEICLFDRLRGGVDAQDCVLTSILNGLVCKEFT